MLGIISRLKNKASFELENLGWLILALIMLAILIIGALILKDKGLSVLILKDKGLSAMDFMKNLLRFKS